MNKPKISLRPGDAKHVPTWEDALELPLPEVEKPEYFRSRLFVRNLDIAVRVLARESHITSITEVYRRLTWLGAALAKSDKRIQALETPFALADRAGLTDTTSVVGDAVDTIGYKFKFPVDQEVKIAAWDDNVKTYLYTAARVCGIHGYNFVVIHLIKAVVDSGLDLADTRKEIFDGELNKWDGHLDYRKIVLDGLVAYNLSRKGL